MLKFCSGALIFVFFSCVCLAIAANFAAHNQTDVSLFMREAPDQALTECFSESGDLYRQLGHHGPAIENPYYALRLYFNHNGGMDLYSKSRAGLELKATRWYPSSAQQRAGFGGDFYHVGDTVGLGGIRLWDGDAVRRLDPVTARYGRVVSEGSSSSMEIRSEGVPYRGKRVDIMVRVTVFFDSRLARVDVFSTLGMPVQFVTGINQRHGQQLIAGDDYLLTWAAASGDVAKGAIEVGAALLYNSEDFEESIVEPVQVLRVSKPCRQLTYWICSANSLESELNTLEAFQDFVEAH